MKRWIHAAKDTDQQVDVSSIYVGQQVKDMSEVDPQVRIVKSVEPSVRGRYEVSFEDGSAGTYEVGDKFAIVSKTVEASSEWAASWNKRQDSGAPYYVMSVPSGIARVLPNDADGSRYHAEIKFRNGENRHSIAFESELDAMDWAENILFNKTYVKSSSVADSCLTASTTTLSDSKSDCQWMLGLYWDIDGHDHTITGVNGYPLLSCEVTEEWISEDTGKPCKSKSWYNIREDENGHIYIQNKKNRNFKLYLNSAFNYKDLVPEEFDELDFLDEDYDDTEYEEEEEYTPSASRHDYSPSNPWDAPGMSIRDFI